MKDLSYYTGREQTYLKHFVLEHYLDRLSWIIGYSKRKLCYVDGFSGPWKSVTEDYGDTSIGISLDILRKTQEGLRDKGRLVEVKCVFVEKDEKPFAELREILKNNAPKQIETVALKGEFEDLIGSILSEVEGFFTLFFIDPTGWKGYRLNRIHPILCLPNSEILINFMFDYINRFLRPDIDESLARSFDELFDDAGNWRTQISANSHRQDAIVSHYKKCLKERGRYKHVANTRILKPTREQTYYHLIYGTRHPKGLKEFKTVDRKMHPVQQNIRKKAIYRAELSRTGQMSMFGSSLVNTEAVYNRYRRGKLAELERLLEGMLLEHKRFTFEDFLLRALEIEMVYEKDAKKIISRARKDKRICIPNWKKNQRMPKDDNIIERYGVTK